MSITINHKESLCIYRFWGGESDNFVMLKMRKCGKRASPALLVHIVQTQFGHWCTFSVSNICRTSSICNRKGPGGILCLGGGQDKQKKKQVQNLVLSECAVLSKVWKVSKCQVFKVTSFEGLMVQNKLVKLTRCVSWGHFAKIHLPFCV